MKASVAELAKLPGIWRGGELENVTLPVHPTGHGALDAQLPGGGWPAGTLSEVLHEGIGIGEVSFLAGALARAAEGERMIAWINAPCLPYAPALAQRGIPLERCLVVRPANREDALWAAEQSLKSGACGAVLLWIAEGARHDDYAWLRRLQMAAEAGRAMAIFFRPSSAERLSTPAHLRVLVSREQGRLKIRIPKRRGPPLEAPVTLDVGFAPRQRPQTTTTPVTVPRRERLGALHLVSR
ncbi:MAG TPA: translesion DNA synthesis-associated protein ImuA [Usitatibacter sp.]|nr:translesion DNA synthesis-associated protein ImuA [Usitatibacter sp.]